jgi:hypothetical protein
MGAMSAPHGQRRGHELTHAKERDERDRIDEQGLADNPAGGDAALSDVLNTAWRFAIAAPHTLRECADASGTTAAALCVGREHSDVGRVLRRLRGNVISRARGPTYALRWATGASQRFDVEV